MLAGKRSIFSPLDVHQPKLEEYSWILRIPSKSTLQGMIKGLGNEGLVVSGNEFDTGILSTVQHSWTATFHANQISIQMDLQKTDSDNNCYTLKPSYLDLISNGKVTSHHVIHFQPTEDSAQHTPTKIWNACWVDNGCWDETVDAVRIIFRPFREFTGTCFVRSVIRKAAALTSSNAERDYMSYFRNTHDPDVTFICRDITFPAHKIVLSNRSLVFEEYFLWGTEEKETITMTDFESAVIRVFLKFMYSGKLELMPESFDLDSLFDLARIYHLDELKMLCEQQLSDRVTKANCIKYYLKYVKIDAPVLKQKCWEVIIQ